MLSAGLRSVGWAVAAKNTASAARDPVSAWDAHRFQALKTEKVDLREVQEGTVVGCRGIDVVFQPLLDQEATELTLDGSESGVCLWSLLGLWWLIGLGRRGSEDWQRARSRAICGIRLWFVVDLMAKGSGNQCCRSMLVMHCRAYRGSFFWRGQKVRRKKKKKKEK